MWHSKFEERLTSWRELRDSIINMPLEQALITVNDWWMQAPLVNHYLHWDDHNEWPDPWDLLADNIYCELARAVGIVYTLHLSEHPEVRDMQLAQVQGSNDNLVLINSGKYAANWAFGELLNIYLQEMQISKTLDTNIVTKKII